MKRIFILALLPFILFAQSGIDLTGMGVRINNYGRLQIYNHSLSGQLYFDQISLLAAYSPSNVFDYFQDAGALDSVKILGSSSFADTGIYVAYNNSYSGIKPNIIVRENLYAWKGSPFILVKFTLINNDSASFNVNTGLEIVPRIGGFYGRDTMKYNFNKNYFKLYKGDQITAFKYFNQDGSQLSSLTGFNYFPLYMKDSLYHEMMHKTVADTTYFSDNTNGAIFITAHGDRNLNFNDSLTFFYAFTMAGTDSLIEANLAAAEIKYNRIITFLPGELAEVPSQFELYQNYPNPFNPSTQISFSLPTEQMIDLSVYNILGEKVSSLIHGIKTAGSYKINFNASSLPSGVYIYRLEGGGLSISQKMLLIR